MIIAGTVKLLSDLGLGMFIPLRLVSNLTLISAVLQSLVRYKELGFGFDGKRKGKGDVYEGVRKGSKEHIHYRIKWFNSSREYIGKQARG